MGRGRLWFEVDVASFEQVPRSPFAYWVSDRLRRLFRELPAFDDEGRTATVGLQSSDDLRFLRLGWECEGVTGFVSFAKGGRLSRHYADVFLAVLWRHNGREIKAYAATTPGSNHWSRNIRSADQYFRPGLTWPPRTQAGLSLRAMPAGCIFAHKGPAAFVEGDGADGLLSLLAITSSKVFRALVDMQMAFGSYEVGVIQRTPVPRFQGEESLDTPIENSHAFGLPALLLVGGESLGARATAWAHMVADSESDLAAIQAEIDANCFGLYQIDESDRLAIIGGFGVIDENHAGDSNGVDDADDGFGAEFLELDPAGLAAGLLSWAVGVAVGRFDVRLATGERGWPVEPEPFDPLPACSPGMLTGDDGLALTELPAGYPVSVSPVLVDDPGHSLDVTGRVRSVFDVVFGVDADEWWSSVGGALGARGGEVGGWLAKGFFDYHLKAYSRSRRKAPVLWPIGTKSGSYLVWLYAHQVSADSLFQVLHDIVVPKLGVEERELTRLRQDAGVNPSLSQRKAIDAQEQFVGELRDLRGELEVVAPLWAPDLSDGIVVVLAPLWRLFAHHRPWSNELKKHWAKLAKGDYDWAQLAMQLWPERVIPKCAADRSLAIAHGFEDIFWVRDPDNEDKWHPRAKPTIPIEQLIAQHHNPATTAALQRESI